MVHRCVQPDVGMVAWGAWLIGALDVGSHCHMSILRNNDIALLNFRNGLVTVFNLRNCHVTCHFL